MPPTATLRSPADIVSAVPYLLGFVPRASIVVLSVRGRRRRCGLVARVDLPDDHQHLPTFAADLTEFVLRDDPVEALVLVYDDQTGPTAWSDLVDALDGSFATAGVPVTRALHVQQGRVRSLRCEPGCPCPDAELHLDPLPATAAAAALVAQGRAPVADRRALADELMGDPAEAHVVARVAARDARTASKGDARTAASWRAARVGLFRDTVRSRQRDLSGERPTALRLDTVVAGRLLAGLSDVEVRDELVMAWPGCLEGAGEPSAVATAVPSPGGPEQDLALVDVLRGLVRVAEGRWAAAPLTLLALRCWSVGEGARANVAATRALAADQDYRLARLVEQLLRTGTPPPGARHSRRRDQAS